MGKEGGFSHTQWQRDNMIYWRQFDKFCLNLTLHFAIDEVEIQVDKIWFYFTLGVSSLNII